MRTPRFIVGIAMLATSMAVLSPATAQSASTEHPSHKSIRGLSADNLTKKTTLVGSDTTTNDNFGFATAQSGSTVIVGAIHHSANDGSAYIFLRSSAGKWSQQAELHPPASVKGGAFGFAVAISGNTAAVAAPFAASDSGAVYVYSRANGKWKLKASFVSSPGVELGWSVALLKTTLITGAPGQGKGAAFVFIGSGATWKQQAVLTPTDSGGAFGVAVSLSGAMAPFTAVVGASSHNSSTGAAYVFQGSGSSWRQKAELVAKDGAAGDEFGSAVANSGTTIVVGAPQEGGTAAGAAYIFTGSSSTFTQQAKLVPEDGTSNEGFGEIIALSGNLIAVGSPLASSAYLYKGSGKVWAEDAEPDGSGLFGDSLALSSSTLVVGDPSPNQSAGVVYLYAIS